MLKVEEALEIHTRDGSADIVRLDTLDIGHVRRLTVAPQTEDDEKDQLLLINNRLELLHIDLEDTRDSGTRQRSLSQYPRCRMVA